MKKSFALIFLLIAVAFAAVTWLRQASATEERSASDADDLQRSQIRDFWAAYHRATESRVAGDFEAAALDYERALALNPEHEESLYYLGNCHFERGDYSQSRLLYEKLLEINPASQRALSQLGITLSSPLPGAEPDWERAAEAFRKSVDVNREESGPFLRLGFLELQRDRPEAAFAHFETAAGFRSPEGLFMAGWVRFRQGDFASAARFFEKVLEIRDHENKISGRGVASEGDVDLGAAALTPLDAAAVKSEAFLAWLPGERRQASRDFLERAAEQRKRVRPCATRPAGLDWSELERIAQADWDGDGDLDLAAVHRTRGPLLLRRSGRSFQVADVSLASLDGAVTELIWGDTDRDGDPDLYVAVSGPTGRGENRLLRNDCQGSSNCRFVDVTAEAGLEGIRRTARALFLDGDGDGDLDLVEAGAGEPPLRLYRNSGDGRFRESSQAAGLELDGTAVDAVVGDFDGDQRPDLFVLRWKRPGLLFLNQGQGRFRETSKEFGLGEAGGEALSALAFDYDRDGRPDLLVATRSSWERSLQSVLRPSLTVPRGSPRLFRNREGRSFEEVTQAAGLNRAWGVVQAVALDFDRDGRTDLLLANGGPEAFRLEPSVLLRNQAGRFTEHVRLPRLDSPANATGAAVIEGEGAAEILLFGAGCFQPVAP